MAIDLISENNNPSSLPTSPRISFSYDLCPKDTSPSSIEHHSHSSHQLSISADFNFSTTPNPSTSSADELFSGGLIRPIPLQQLPIPSKSPPPSSSSLPPLPKTPPKSLCHIRRSSSLHCEATHKKSPFWSSFPLLRRSFSVGSVGKGKKQINAETKQRLQRSSSSSATFYTFPSSPPRRNGGDGVRINPVINILPRDAANLFRFGALFRNGKEKNKKLSL
ncbi:PREDICTED: uncharacterized protein LOC109172229 [Ipomoea nil]|uniref:uncharacterized protein LOC109172229 n=1 Tax=Ipomoea nil TaxID=35883 RepID=UPI00090100D7|nr:PREDICTED: uncharacterized protein LOC109172229 [Ipomoea nil]